MDNEYVLGTYRYYGKINYNYLPKLPERLKFGQISVSGVLIQLIMGKVIIKDEQDNQLFDQKVNYTKLPMAEGGRHSYAQFNEVLGIDVTDNDSREICNKFLIRDARNNFVYEHILNELTQYFVIKDKSPCEGFVHLYRLLEFMSYSFPLIYSSKSRDYRGSYESLKKFFKGGDNMGELKFLSFFLDELFSDEKPIYEYEFEILVDSEHIDELRKDFMSAITMDIYTFENETLTIKYKQLKDIFVEIRNRYFHMLLGKGTNNFLNMDYDKNDIFRSLNPVFVNWLSCIFVKIMQHGLSLF